MPGPVRKRDAELRHPRKDGQIETTRVDLDALIMQDVEIPAPPTKVDKTTGELKWAWHPVAQAMYQSMSESGQAIFYEPSDWALAYTLCETLSRELDPQPVSTTRYDDEGREIKEVEWVIMPIKGASLTAFLKGMTTLMVGEGDRRRLGIELERKKATDAAAASPGVVVSITQNRMESLA